MNLVFLWELFFIFKGCFLLDCVSKQFSFICIDKDLITFPKSNLINKDIKILDLSKNNIRILYEDALDYFDNLINLTLDSNKIWKITNNAFKNQHKLKHLSLKNNALIISNKTFLSSVFKYLVRLEYLDLSNNPLGIIPENFFIDLRNLRVLYLEEMVKEIRIQKGALSSLFNLKLLSLAKNNFISLPSYLENEFQEMQLESLLLQDNPWACDCRMRWFKRWLITMNQNNINLYSSIENILSSIHPMLCEVPEFLQGKKLFDQPLSKFECKPKTLKLGKTIVVNHLENVTISCHFESYPKSYVKWFKNGILIQDHWDRIKINQSNGQNFIANLTILSSKYGIDDGSYVCETTNNVGSARSNYTLIIKIPSYKDNLIEYKQQQTILLLIIVASGVITLIILVGIVIYCFYGNNSNNEIPFNKTFKKSNLLYVNDKVLMTCNSDIISTSPLLKVFSKHDLQNDLSPWNNDVPMGLKDSDRKKINIEPYSSKIENNENPIVKNFMVNESLFSNHTSDSDNHSCQLSIHEDCPVHGSGNSYSCPIHGSENEVIEMENSSNNWSYVFNNKNTITNNYYSLKSTFTNKNGCNIRNSANSYAMNIKTSDIENNDCTISIDNITGQHLFPVDQN